MMYDGPLVVLYSQLNINRRIACCPSIYISSGPAPEPAFEASRPSVSVKIFVDVTSMRSDNLLLQQFLCYCEGCLVSDLVIAALPA